MISFWLHKTDRYVDGELEFFKMIKLPCCPSAGDMFVDDEGFDFLIDHVTFEHDSHCCIHIKERISETDGSIRLGPCLMVYEDSGAMNVLNWYEPSDGDDNDGEWHLHERRTYWNGSKWESGSMLSFEPLLGLHWCAWSA